MACIEGQCQYDCEAGLSVCTAPPAAIFCTDLSSDPQNCGTCGTVCESEVCEAGTCTAPTTRAITDDGTPTTTSPRDEEATAQDAVDGESERTGRTRRDRTEQGTTPASGATSPDAGTTAPQRRIQSAGSSAPDSVLTWPFDPEAGQWTIVHGYRAEDEATTTVATPPADRGDFTRLALEFAVCPQEDVDAVEGTCDLGPASRRSGAATDDPGWDAEATQGAPVLSPVDGTVAWTAEANAACQSVGIDIKGHRGYRVALFNVEGTPERGQSVTRGKRIGKVAKGGCEEGDALSMVLYQPQEGASDDPVAGRQGVPFNGEWAIANCDYPDDRRTVNQYRGELVPCPPEDTTSPSS
jgi:hypothetical protein